jgi:spore coat protein U-like protein
MLKCISPLLLILLLAPSISQAQSSALNLSNTATITPACEFTSSTINLGAYNPLSDQLVQGHGVIKVKCTVGTVGYTYNAGQNGRVFKNPSETYSRCQRAMKSATGNYVAYDVNFTGNTYDSTKAYQPVYVNNRCSDSSSAYSTVNFTPEGNREQEIQLTATIRNDPADKARSIYINPLSTPAGVYTDTITINFTY